MKLFNLIDKSTHNVLCDLCEFGDGKIVVRWISVHSSIVIWDSMNDFMNVSCSINSNRELVEVNLCCH